MQLTVSTQTGEVFTVEVDEQADVSTLKAILEAETGISTDKQAVYRHGREIPASGTLQNAQVQHGDLLMVMQRLSLQHVPVPQLQRPQQQPQALTRDGSLQNPQAFLHAALNNPAMLSQYPPAVRDAVSSGDIEAVQFTLRQMHEADRMEAELIRPGEDPMDPAVQARIAAYIQQKNIQENHDLAWEHNPEVFASVTMLYVNMDAGAANIPGKLYVSKCGMQVNGNKLAAFIDSGAQTTIMSVKCAERLNLLRLMDTRYQSIAKGVGTCKILGRVHQAPLKIGNQQVTASITILEQDGMEFLFGLDMLRRYQCSIDLHKNVLRFGSINNAELPFLADHELPARLRREDSDEQAGGSGRLGGGTGAGPAPGPATHPNAGGVTTILDRTPASQPQQAAAAAAAARAAGIASLAGSRPAQNPAAAAANATAAATAAASAPRATAAAPPGGTNRPTGVDQAAVQRLMGLGFTQQESTGALQMCNGNEDQAASLLFESSFGG